MLIRSYTHWLLVVGACFFAVSVHADPFNPLAGPWTATAPAPAAKAAQGPAPAAAPEHPLALPAMPQPRVWRVIPVVRSTPWTAWFDPASVASSGSVARLALRAVSKAGAVSVVYEGVNCSDQTYAIYAAGVDHRWSSVAHPRWRPITAVTPAFQDVLYQQYLCRGDRARTVSQILAAIQAAAINAAPQDVP